MNKRSWIGPVLILLGCYLFFFRKEAMSTGSLFGHFWPTMFIIPLGLFFHWLYFSLTERRAIGLLIPGGILFTVGLVCQLSTLFDSWQYLWPGFILAPAIGLFEFYWFGNRNKYLLIPINILGALSLLFFAVFSLGTLYNRMILGQPLLAIALIIIGAGVMIAPKSKRRF
ncbi:hypothetical protein KB559_16210 [Paenibacillus sp. Marseille-P2973]|uniref:hypothetical protein n=1 Tax=unclassified Paenibacillus TaxID=185978 RepID=UPI001B37FE56|nr:hypothetical protein [Paenibacillus sp. Marseille-P2973]MBQ4900382.1 hypothetical protein [Paenibacillus sp. Marseille-P2973]